jgi:hypothetical protein
MQRQSDVADFHRGDLREEPRARASLAHVGDALRSQDQSSITRLPASVILMRPTKGLSSASCCAIANPALTKPASVPRVKPLVSWNAPV